MIQTQKQINRFWSKVDKTDSCWNWTGGKDRDGYGIFFANKSFRAHRFSALLAGKNINLPVVRHLCNNPACVRPEHLEPGTQKDNIYDMISAGRDNTKGNRSTPIITPLGEFSSMYAAAIAHHIDPQTVKRRLKNKVSGWCYKLCDKNNAK